MQAAFFVHNTKPESCIKLSHNTCLWVVPSHFQPIKMSNRSVSTMLSKYSIFFAGNVWFCFKIPFHHVHKICNPCPTVTIVTPSLLIGHSNSFVNSVTMIKFIIWPYYTFYHGHGWIFDLNQWDGLFGVMWPALILQPRPLNYDLLTTTCVSLAFELIKTRSLMPQYASEWRD